MLGRLMTLIVGGALGAAAAALLAPRAGTETREQLRARAREARSRYEEAVEQGRLRATELVKSGIEVMDERLSQSQEALNTGLEKAKRRLETQEPELRERPQPVPEEETR